MKKKVVLLWMSIACVAMLAGCGSDDSANKDPLTGQEQTTEINSEDVPMDDQMGMGTTDEFDSLLGESGDANGIIDYINTNIGDAMDSDVDRFFRGLLGYGDNIRDIDFTRLDESRQYMPEDMVAFMELMKLEGESPSMTMSNDENRMTIGLTLSEMLERAVLFEQHIEKYPDDVSTEAATDLYLEIATNAITGGYDKTAGVPHYYQGESEDVVDQESLSYYQQFAEANKDSRLGQLVQEYVTLLQENQFQINEELENFYRGVPQRLQPATEENQTTEMGTMDGANGTNSTTATQNGTANGANGTTGTQSEASNGARGMQNGTNGNMSEGTMSGTIQNAMDGMME